MITQIYNNIRDKTHFQNTKTVKRRYSKLGMSQDANSTTGYMGLTIPQKVILCVLYVPAYVRSTHPWGFGQPTNLGGGLMGSVYFI